MVLVDPNVERTLVQKGIVDTEGSRQASAIDSFGAVYSKLAARLSNTCVVYLSCSGGCEEQQRLHISQRDCLSLSILGSDFELYATSSAEVKLLPVTNSFRLKGTSNLRCPPSGRIR